MDQEFNKELTEDLADWRAKYDSFLAHPFWQWMMAHAHQRCARCEELSLTFSDAAVREENRIRALQLREIANGSFLREAYQEGRLALEYAQHNKELKDDLKSSPDGTVDRRRHIPRIAL